MKKIKITSVSGHQTILGVQEDCISTIKQSFLDAEPFFINFQNKTIWVNPDNIYFVEIENNPVNIVDD